MIREALETRLTPQEQEVIRTSMLYYKPGSEHQRLPNEVSADLARRLSTTPENVRKIKQRAMAKIREALDATGHSTVR